MAIGYYEFLCGGTPVAAQQRPEAFAFFTKLFHDHPVDRIIEIGTAHGGLTLWLRKTTGLPITTYDIVERPLYPTLREAGVKVETSNVFDPYCKAEIAANIQEPGRVMLLCDGGDKTREFNQFADYLKPGDIIMAHDYSRDHDTYEVTKSIWPWWEIAWSGIQAACERNNLTQIAPESEDVVWVVMQRKGA